jgi:Holliday junction resolvase
MRARKVDANHKEVADALRAIGCSVADLSGAGNGIPDLLVAPNPQHNILIEVKDGRKSPSRRKKTPAQVRFHEEWRGPIYVVNSVDEAIAVVNEARISSN